MIEIVAMLSWLTALYLVCVYVNLPNEINLLLFNIFFFALMTKNQITGFCPVNKHFLLYFSEKNGIFFLLNVNT